MAHPSNPSDNNISEMAFSQIDATSLEKLFHISPEMLCVASFDGYFQRLNPAFEKILGWPQEELKGKPFLEFVIPEDREKTQKEMQQLIEGIPTLYFENSYLCKDGEKKILAWTAISNPAEKLVYAFARDITLQKKKEEALRESEQKFRSLVEFCPDAIFIHRNGIFLYANTAAMALLGATQIDQIVGTIVLDIIHPDYRVLVQGRINTLRQQRSRIHSVEEKMLCFDGKIVDVEVSAQCVNYDGDMAIMAICKDVTKRKKVEEKQKQHEALNWSIIEAMPGGIVQVAANGSILYANQKAQDIFGLSYDEFTSRYITDFRPETIWEDGSPCPVEEYPVSKCLQTGLPQAPTTIGFRRPDGKISWAIFRAIPLENIEDEKKIGAIVTFIDITDRKQLEEEYRQAQKMEAIGQLAGGLAHDFNNLLSAVIGYSELALIGLSPGNSYYEEFQKIYEAGKRAEGLTRQLLAFSRKQVLQIKVINLSEGIADFVSIISRLIGEHIILDVELSPVLGQVKADLAQIQQIIMNLAVNARDAMPNGGTLTIKTTNVSFQEKDPSSEIPVGDYVLLSVEDTGQGIDADTLPHIFDPFFTTKQVGQGTGLGLSTVYGIVKQHNGYISIWSELNKGARFEIYFPMVQQALSTPTPNKPFHLKDRQGHERILVVEDEPIVRQLVKNILTTHGYQVFEAENAQKALEMTEKNPTPIDLLFTDVVMPGLNGKELYDQLKQTFPHLKVVYTSGYSQEVIDHKGVLAENVQLLQKPFIVEKLLWKIQETLDQETV